MLSIFCSFQVLKKQNKVNNNYFFGTLLHVSTNIIYKRNVHLRHYSYCVRRVQGWTRYIPSITSVQRVNERTVRDCMGTFASVLVNRKLMILVQRKRHSIMWVVFVLFPLFLLSDFALNLMQIFVCCNEEMLLTSTMTHED